MSIILVISTVLLIVSIIMAFSKDFDINEGGKVLFFSTMVFGFMCAGMFVSIREETKTIIPSHIFSNKSILIAVYNQDKVIVSKDEDIVHDGVNGNIAIKEHKKYNSYGVCLEKNYAIYLYSELEPKEN